MMAQDPFGFGNLDDLFRQMSRQMQQGNSFYEQTPPTQTGGNGIIGGQPPRNGQAPSGLLGEYGINITQQARDGGIDPVVGRDDEIRRVIEILNRRTKTILY